MAGDPSDPVITGIGVVSSLGVGCDAYWSSLCAGTSGITPIAGIPVPSGYPAIAGEVRAFAPRDYIGAQHLRRMDKLSRMIVAASRMALDDSSGSTFNTPLHEVGVVVATAFGNTSESAAYLQRVVERGAGVASPMLFPNLVMNAPAGYLAMELGLTGSNFTVSQGEISGEHAVMLACDMVRSGRVDVALAGGGDEISNIVYELYGRSRALSSQRGGKAWSSPYDAGRNGLILGEGAAMLVIESAAHARARRASVYAAIERCAAFTALSPAYDWPASAREALPALRALVAGDNGEAERLDLICGSANSTRRLDACEIDLFAHVCGEGAGGVWLTSIKGATGDFGTAGVLSIATACMALRDQVVPPLCEVQQPEAAIPFRLARKRAEPQRVRYALVCGIARGGAGVALRLRRAAS